MVVVSIDGLKPDYVLESQKHGLKIPNLRRFLQEGTYASGVEGVVPTVTYPSHTTLVTGVAPSVHGIFANTPFDPLGKNLGGWYWYSSDIRVSTLWDLASRAGLTTGNIHWPVTVGAAITYNVPQYWRAGTSDDAKVVRALSTPGLLEELERDLGPYAEGNDETIEGDERRSRFNVRLIETKRPRLHFAYFTGFDHDQHDAGPYSAKALAGLERIDKLLGDVRGAVEKSGGGSAYICVVSDHGFFATTDELHLNAALRQAGLISVDDRGRVVAYQAFAWTSGGSAAVMLKDGAGNAVREKSERSSDNSQKTRWRGSTVFSRESSWPGCAVSRAQRFLST